MTNPYDPRSGPPQGSSQPGQPEPAGYRAPPGGPWGASAATFQAAYAPAQAVPAPAENSIYGDGAGEYMRMDRGRYNAWPHVVIAFIYEMGMIGLIVGAPLAYLAALVMNDGGVTMAVGAIAGGAAGIAGAYFIFRDRWKVTEAFASRFCIGLMNLSILYVPLVAFVYANVRGIQKLGGK